MTNTKLQKYREEVSVGKVIEENIDKKAFAKVILKNAPTLLSAIPLVGNLASAVTQTAVASAVDYWDEITSKKREEEFKSYLKNLDDRLKKLEIKAEASEYFENTIIFRYEDIKRKLFTEPGRGFDELLAEFVATSLSDFTTPPLKKDLILSTLLFLDNVDLQVFMRIDSQFKHELANGRKEGASYTYLITVMKPFGIDEIMVSRSIQRLQSQDLIMPLTNNVATLRELPSQEDLLAGKKTPQNYSQGGFIVTAFGRQFFEFLKLEDLLA